VSCSVWGGSTVEYAELLASSVIDNEAVRDLGDPPWLWKAAGHRCLAFLIFIRCNPAQHGGTSFRRSNVVIRDDRQVTISDIDGGMVRNVFAGNRISVITFLSIKYSMI
jgi:hypothetical protein